MYIPQGFTAVLKQLASAGEDDESDLSITQHRELIGLLHQPSSSLRECHLPSRRVLDPLDLNLSASHLKPKQQTLARPFFL